MILFDLGGVLVENASFDALATLLPEPINDSILKQRWLHCDVVREFELGRVDPETFASRFIDKWGLALSPGQFIERFAGWPKGPYPGAKQLVADLRRDHAVGCLSNCNEIHWNRFSSFLNWFDWTFSSHLLGCIKPDEEVFDSVLARTGNEPSDVWFFDDSVTNVDAAAAVGIRAFLVDGVGDARAVLQQHGLLQSS